MQRYQVLSRLPEKPCETLWRYEALISRPIMWYRRTHPRTQTLAHTHTHAHIHKHIHTLIHTHSLALESGGEENKERMWYWGNTGQAEHGLILSASWAELESQRRYRHRGNERVETRQAETDWRKWMWEYGKSWKYIHTHIPGQTRNWSLQCPLTCKNTYNEHVHEHTLKDSLSAFMPNMDTLYARAYPSFAEYCARRHKGWLAASWNSQTVHHKYMW